MSVEGALAARISFLWQISCPCSRAARMGELDKGILQIGVPVPAKVLE